MLKVSAGGVGSGGVECGSGSSDTSATLGTEGAFWLGSGVSSSLDGSCSCLMLVDEVDSIYNLI